MSDRDGPWLPIVLTGTGVSIPPLAIALPPQIRKLENGDVQLRGAIILNAAAVIICQGEGQTIGHLPDDFVMQEGVAAPILAPMLVDNVGAVGAHGTVDSLRMTPCVLWMPGTTNQGASVETAQGHFKGDIYLQIDPNVVFVNPYCLNLDGLSYSTLPING